MTMRAQHIREAINHLRAARDILAAERCPRSLIRVRLAITSAEGAERNALVRPNLKPWDEGPHDDGFPIELDPACEATK